MNNNTENKNNKILKKDDENKEMNKLDEIEKVKPIIIDNNEEDLDIKEKIRINSIEILINIVTLMPSKTRFFNFKKIIFINY